MTILSLCLYLAVFAATLTFLLKKYTQSIKHVGVSFLQNFCGSLFIFSGMVKAVDPMGTAFKMEEYFEEFEATAKGSFLHFMSDLFPVLAKYALGFSVFMIVLEIIIGILLLIGHKPKLTSWLFFIIMVFFTILTGYTFLTGYVPKEANFFEFGKWTVFAESNMRVTNCGCFGDFLKLTPDVSFKKDLILMIPAIIFLFSRRKFHTVLSSSLRNAISFFAITGLYLFSLANFKWNEPVVDFRPFKVGTDVRTKQEEEKKAAADVKIEKWKLKNKASGEVRVLDDKEYMENIKSYPKTEWEVAEQIKSLPAIPITKISDFAIFDLQGSEYTEDILTEQRSRIMVNMPKLSFTSHTEVSTVQDSVWKYDTIVDLKTKEIQVVKSFAELKSRTIKKNIFEWNEDYKKILTGYILPFIDSLRQDSVKTFFVAGGASEEALTSLFDQLGVKEPIFTADDVLLKTIMRSNPGIILWRNGKIIMKWHYRRLPEMTDMRRDFLNWSAPPIH
ncbi:MAG: hypothetical protein U0V49_11700 [Saprospiraceae bacterium]